MARAWPSPLVAEMLARAGGRWLRAPTGWRKISACVDGGYHLSDAQAQAILEMRLQRLTGLEQDKIVSEYKEVMLQIADYLDILAKPARITAIIVDEMTAIKEQYGDHEEERDRAQSPGRRRRGPDHAGRHGGDAVAHRLHQVAAARRLQCAAPRRARQAGDRDQGRRFHRAAVHRQYPRLRAVLFQPRPRVLDQGLPGAAGQQQRAAANPWSICSRWRRARKSPPSCR